MLVAADAATTGFGWSFEGMLRLTLVLLLGGATVLLMLTWAMWLAGLGRFKQSAQSGTPSRGGFTQWVVAGVMDFFTKLIDDFRHFLALVIMAVFVIAMILMLWPGLSCANGTYAQMKDGLQTVVACLGGLIGSIIGYYFGESAVARAKEAEGGADNTRGTPRAPIGTPPSPSTPGKAPPPPVTAPGSNEPDPGDSDSGQSDTGRPGQPDA